MFVCMYVCGRPYIYTHTFHHISNRFMIFPSFQVRPSFVGFAIESRLQVVELRSTATMKACDKTIRRGPAGAIKATWPVGRIFRRREVVAGFGARRNLRKTEEIDPKDFSSTYVLNMSNYMNSADSFWATPTDIKIAAQKKPKHVPPKLGGWGRTHWVSGICRTIRVQESIRNCEQDHHPTVGKKCLLVCMLCIVQYTMLFQKKMYLIIYIWRLI